MNKIDKIQMVSLWLIKTGVVLLAIGGFIGTFEIIAKGTTTINASMELLAALFDFMGNLKGRENPDFYVN